MAIDFYDPACRSITSEAVFGIFDAQPAALKFTEAENWEVWIDNLHEREITHIAIDHCLNIPRAEGERCESMIMYDDVVVFIELKDRGGGRWAEKSRDQLMNTIKLFKRDGDISSFTKHYGHIANKQRPHFKAGGARFSQRFEDETGFVLRVSDVITIE